MCIKKLQPNRVVLPALFVCLIAGFDVVLVAIESRSKRWWKYDN